jgi:hypothetical protein
VPSPGPGGRALLLGSLLALAISLGAPAATWVLGSSELTWSFFPIGVGFPFLCLLFSNLALKALRPAWALRPAELALVLAMGLVVAGTPFFMMGYVLAIPTTPDYFASPENQWPRYVLPYLPRWLIPSNEGLAMTWFFEGLPFGEPAPWGALLDAWMMPLFWWFSFLGALYFACFALVVILRRQWVERERLAYPLMEVPQALLAEGGPALLRRPLLWLGASFPLSIALWNIAGFFHPWLTPVSWDYVVQVGRDFPPLFIRLYFPVIGFLYFTKLNVSFSIWFFYLVALIEEGVCNRLGLGISEGDAFVVGGFPTTSWQCWGAFVAMVLWGLWMARDHLRQVWRKARDPGSPVDDSRELLSYRAAVTGLALALAYLLAWLCKAGLPLGAAALFLAGVLVAYLGITRLVVQAGVYYLTTPMVSQAMTLAVLGSRALPPQGMVALGLSFSFFGDVQSIFMPAAAHAARLGDALGLGRRSLGLAIALALALGFAASTLYILHMAYDQGASNFSSWFFRVSGGAGVLAFDYAAARIANPAGVQYQKLALFGGGALAMAGLTLLHYRFPWWPLHPIGLTIVSAWMVRNQAAAIFVAWAAKSLIMRFGGIDLYRRATPFFIGLILGHFLGVGLSFLIDALCFPGRGHPILHG